MRTTFPNSTITAARQTLPSGAGADTLSIATATALDCLTTRSTALPERRLSLHIVSPHHQFPSLDCDVARSGLAAVVFISVAFVSASSNTNGNG